MDYRFNIALIYDFDGTLAPGNMQEYDFIPAVGKSNKEFWTEANTLAEEQDADMVLTYMARMLQEAKSKGLSLRREAFQDSGRRVTLYKGVKEWFEQFEQPVLKEVDISGINSPNAILMQARGGKILGEINGEAQIYPASMTKIMTVILGIENFDDLDEKITLTNEMFTGLYEQDATQAGFQPGEEVRVIDLLYGAMLPSGAECCIALADTISGSEADFAELMNKKARKLGMENTHFCDSTGLHNPDHYSTVKDIAVLMKYCIKNDTFREIVETSRHSTGVTNIHPDGITYYSTMFKNLSDPTVTGGKILGGKTGYTSEAGHCLVSFAEIEGREYIFVSAGASGADGNTIPHIQDAVTVYNRVGAAVEAKMNDNNK